MPCLEQVAARRRGRGSSSGAGGAPGSGWRCAGWSAATPAGGGRRTGRWPGRPAAASPARRPRHRRGCGSATGRRGRARRSRGRRTARRRRRKANAVRVTCSTQEGTRHGRGPFRSRGRHPPRSGHGSPALERRGPFPERECGRLGARCRPRVQGPCAETHGTRDRPSALSGEPPWPRPHSAPSPPVTCPCPSARSPCSTPSRSPSARGIVSGSSRPTARANPPSFGCSPAAWCPMTVRSGCPADGHGRPPRPGAGAPVGRDRAPRPSPVEPA